MSLLDLIQSLLGPDLPPTDDEAENPSDAIADEVSDEP